MTQPRNGHTATALADGRVLVVGGAPAEAVSGPTAVPAEIREPADRTVDADRAAAPRTRGAHRHPTRRRAVPIAGGRHPLAPDGPLPKISAAEVWDARTGDWTDVGPMHVPRIGHDAGLLGDGRVLIAGPVHRKATSGTRRRTRGR